MPFILVSTYHDPLFRLEEVIKQSLPFLKTHFKKIFICYTPLTSSNAVEFLKKNNITAQISPNLTQVDTYNTSLKLALEHEQYSSDTKLLSIDFDRVVHWIMHYPNELLNVLHQSSQFDFVHLARTPRAFNTHPKTQRATEQIINDLCSAVIGFKEKSIDMVSVCFLMTPSLAKELLQITHHSPSGIYYTWPIYLWKKSSTPKYVEVEGLEWETPDQYQPEIIKQGHEQWLKRFQSFDEWNKRVQFIKDCVEEIIHLAEWKILDTF